MLNHAQDLLDHRTIEKDGFVPCYTVGSVTEAIHEVIIMMRQTLTSDNIEIQFIGKKAHNNIMFDKRRLQQVLLNVLSNAIKFQAFGEIRVFSSI